MSHNQRPADDGLGERLRASIETGDLPAIDLAEVQRRADRRARGRTVGTAVVAGAGALALAVVLAITVPAINAVTGGRSTSSASGSLAEQGAAGPGGDLADPSLWPTLPSLEGRSDWYLSAAQVTSALGVGAWEQSMADMAGPWTSWECSPNPSREAAKAEAALRPVPLSTHVEPWDVRRPELATAPEDPTLSPYEAFASLGVLRWDPEASDDVRTWQQLAAEEAARCPGAVTLSPGAAIASMPVAVIARPATTDPAGGRPESWSAMATLAGGPTAVQVTYDGAPSAQVAGEAALALLREGVAAVAAGDRAARALAGGARSGGADDVRLSNFADPDRWEDLPVLRTIGVPPQVPVVAGGDLAAALPGTGSWESQPIGGTGVNWTRSWCTPDQLFGLETTGARDGGAPADEMTSIWLRRSGVVQRPRVDVDVLRWHSRDLSEDPAGGPAGVDGVALTAADAWGAAVADDAATCSGATALDATGLPGAHATLAAVDEDGTWRVQATAVGGPTAVRIRATITADNAAAAGDQAVAIARRVIANTVRADEVELGRPDPGPLP